MSHLARQSVLSNDDISIRINSHGAELQSFFSKKLDLELLWQADANVWPRHAPVLFPIVGKLENNQLIENGKTYPLTQHGFARDLEFEAIHQSENLVQLRLTSSEITLKSYPYRFELIVEYLLVDNMLRTTYIVRNNTEITLPFCIGGHPAFNWPLVPGYNKDAHTILFDQQETARLIQLEEGLISQQDLPSPIKNRVLELTDNIFKNDALIFDGLRSNKITYSVGEKCSIEMVFDDFPQLGIWSKRGADFICLEPWVGYASPKGFNGEFRNKPGIKILPGFAEAAFSFDLLLNLE